MFGDVPAILGTSNELDAYAVTDVDLMWIAARDLPDLLARVPGLARKWVTSLSERLLETHQRLYEVLAGHLDLRIAAVLLRRAGAGGHVDITQAKLARLLGQHTGTRGPGHQHRDPLGAVICDRDRRRC